MAGKTDQVTVSDTFDADISVVEAIQKARVDVTERFDTKQINSADASRHGGTGEWYVNVTAELSEGDDD